MNRVSISPLGLLVTFAAMAGSAAGADRVDVCHVTGSGSASLLTINAATLAVHLGHGDFLPRIYFADLDGDGFGTPQSMVVGCAAAAGQAENDEDCDDGDPEVHPAAIEIPGDGIDNDCDPATSDALHVCSGGREATEGAHPYRVSIQRLVTTTAGDLWEHVCGGTYLGADKVLTAASCVAGGSPLEIRAGLGSNALSAMPVVTGVTGVSLHPSWSATDPDRRFDAAVVTLAAVPSAPSISALAPAAAGALDVDGLPAAIVGWGRTALAPQVVNNRIQEGSLVAIGNDECASRFAAHPAAFGAEHLCVNDRSAVADPCLGDLGGPVVIDGVVAGIQSWPVDRFVPVDDVGFFVLPRVATRVAAIAAWLATQLP